MAGTVVGPQRLDPEALARLAQRRLEPLEKALPPGSAGVTAAEFLAARPHLSAFATPVLVLDASAIDANVARMAAWCAERGVGLAPHGKTTMAPVLWERQLAAGAWGITLATPSQVRVALAFGLRRVLLANALVDPVGIAAVSRALDADPELQVLSWVDSVSSVAAMDAVLAGLRPARPLTVLVELGAPGGRTGARDLPAARAVATAVAASPHLHLGGVAGYEGALAHDASPSRARRRPPLPARPRRTARRRSSARYEVGRRGRHRRRQRLLRRRRGRPRPAGRAGHPGRCCGRAPTSSTTTASTGASRPSPGTATPR